MVNSEKFEAPDRSSQPTSKNARIDKAYLGDNVNKADFASVSQSKKTANEQFRALATAMASNGIVHSVTPRRFSTVFKHALRSPQSNLAQPRVVVIVGAGASIAAAKHLRSEYRGVRSDLIDSEIENLSLQHNIDEDDFETTLLALSKFDRPYVLGKLRAIFDRRYDLWLGYELLAHCLKHRFVDAIINFNSGGHQQWQSPELHTGCATRGRRKVVRLPCRQGEASAPDCRNGPIRRGYASESGERWSRDVLVAGDSSGAIVVFGAALSLCAPVDSAPKSCAICFGIRLALP